MKARFLTLQSFDWKLSIFAYCGHWQFSLVGVDSVEASSFQSIGTLSRKLPESIFSLVEKS